MALIVVYTVYQVAIRNSLRSNNKISKIYEVFILIVEIPCVPVESAGSRATATDSRINFVATHKRQRKLSLMF